MYDEPHRWLQAVENRIQYVEKRLRTGSPVVGLPYEHGALLFTMRPHGQQKVYEVYDRLALAGLGHPADVERLRMMAINLAHTEGFVRSAEDVTLQRLLNFAIAPQVKQAFDEVFRSPVIAKFLMVELAPKSEDTQFYTLSFDGNFTSRRQSGAAAGSPQAEQLMLEQAETCPPASPSLEDAVRCATLAWGVGYHVATKEAEYTDPPKPSDAAISATLDAAAERHVFEAAVLDRTVTSRAKFRQLTEDELAAATTTLDEIRPNGNGDQ